jgi:hypothetical protein
MSKRTEPIPRKGLPALSPELAQAYAGTERTLSRDVNALKEMGLIERVPKGWRSCKKSSSLSLPVRRPRPAGCQPTRTVAGAPRLRRFTCPGGQTLFLVSACYTNISLTVGGASASDPGPVCSGPIMVRQ